MKFHHLVVEFHGMNNQHIGVKCKRVDAPRLTLSMRTALQDLELSKLWVFYPGLKAYPLAENVFAVPLSKLSEDQSSDIFK